MSEPIAPLDVFEIRRGHCVGVHILTQREFAELYGFSAAAVRDWEQGRRRPSRTAEILLRLIGSDGAGVRRIMDQLQPGRTQTSKIGENNRRRRWSRER